MSQNLISFIYQGGMSCLIYGFLARTYVMPYLRRLPLANALQILFVPYLWRQVGGMYLVPTVVPNPPSIPWAWATLLGDLLCVLLALAAIVALRGNAKSAITVCWIFSVVNLLDYAVIGTWGYAINVLDYAGAHFYVVAYYDTLLAVLQVLIIIKLWTRQA